MKKFLTRTLLIVSSMLLLTACAPKPESTLTAFLDTFKTITVENAQTLEIAQYFDGDFVKDETLTSIETLNDENTAYVNRLYDLLAGFDYVVNETTVVDETATVSLTITTYPIGQIFSDYIMQAFTKAFEWAFSGVSQEEQAIKMSELFLEVSKDATKTYTETIDVDLVKVEDAWVLSSGEKNEALMNALTGGMVKWAKTFSEELATEE